MSETVTIDRAVLQATFDTAIHSMDFGSGFLDDEEVVALRNQCLQGSRRVDQRRQRTRVDADASGSPRTRSRRDDPHVLALPP